MSVIACFVQNAELNREKEKINSAQILMDPQDMKNNHHHLIINQLVLEVELSMMKLYA
jgi:hypothetical protein